MTTKVRAGFSNWLWCLIHGHEWVEPKPRVSPFQNKVCYCCGKEEHRDYA